MEDAANFAKSSDVNSNPMNNGRFSNRAARFYWADEEPSPQRAYNTQQILLGSDSHFEESPYVIGAISAGAIGVAIIIIILVGFWIRSRLYPEGRNSEHPNNMSERSSISTLDEDTYVISMEMVGDVLGSMSNVQDHYPENITSSIEVEPSATTITEVTVSVPENIVVSSSLDTVSATAGDDSNSNTNRIEDSNAESMLH